MAALRALFRLAGFSMYTLALILVLLAGILLLFPFNSLSRRFNTVLLHWWAVGTARIIGMKITVKGIPPEPPFIMVCNHLSYLDALPLLAHARGVFISRYEVRSWPFAGRLMQLLGMVFIKPSFRHDFSRIGEKMNRQITEQQGLIFFPEETTTEGFEVGSFHTSLLSFPVEWQFPVSYAAVTYSINGRHSAREYLCWRPGRSIAHHFFKALSLKRFEAVVNFGKQKVWKENRKELAAELHNRISRLFVPVDYSADHTY